MDTVESFDSLCDSAMVEAIPEQIATTYDEMETTVQTLLKELPTELLDSISGYQMDQLLSTAMDARRFPDYPKEEVDWLLKIRILSKLPTHEIYQRALQGGPASRIELGCRLINSPNGRNFDSENRLYLALPLWASVYNNEKVSVELRSIAISLICRCATIKTPMNADYEFVETPFIYARACVAAGRVSGAVLALADKYFVRKDEFSHFESVWEAFEATSHQTKSTLCAGYHLGHNHQPGRTTPCAVCEKLQKRVNIDPNACQNHLCRNTHPNKKGDKVHCPGTCSGDSKGKYCSIACRDQAWRLRHHIECKIETLQTEDIDEKPVVSLEEATSAADAAAAALIADEEHAKSKLKPKSKSAKRARKAAASEEKENIQTNDISGNNNEELAETLSPAKSPQIQPRKKTKFVTKRAVFRPLSDLPDLELADMRQPAPSIGEFRVIREPKPRIPISTAPVLTHSQKKTAWAAKDNFNHAQSPHAPSQADIPSLEVPRQNPISKIRLTANVADDVWRAVARYSMALEAAGEKKTQMAKVNESTTEIENHHRHADHETTNKRMNTNNHKKYRQYPEFHAMRIPYKIPDFFDEIAAIDRRRLRRTQSFSGV